ncbi:MAG TPA: CheR family methyltransferase [Polyangiales bacterium]|nr:CheR family methyltransferase [Polyangiales bacterium]
MTSTADTAAFDRIADLVTGRTGILMKRAQTDLARATRHVIDLVGLRDLRELENRLTAGTLWEELLDQVTVRETYFFRNPEHFELIRDTIVPALRKARHPIKRLRVWSAGCASGEEVYSLAILLHEQGILEDSYLIGTDVSQHALATARTGRYREWSFRAIDPALVPLYFRREQQEYVVTDELRKHVTFQQLNLVAEQANSADDVGPFDLIMCRNVMIYFGTDSIARLERRLFDALVPGGWLITGPSDPTLGQRAPFEVVVLPQGVCYRRAPEPIDQPRAPQRLESRQLRSPLPVPDPPLESTPPAETSLESLHEQALAAFERADYARTIAIAHTLPDDLELSVLGVRATWNLEGARPAERSCSFSLRKHSMAAELHYLHAMTLMDCKRLQDALHAVRCALYLDRSLAIAHFAHGAILERLNDLEGARRAYRNTYEGCKKSQPDDVVAFGDGIVAEGLGNAAAHALKELAKRCPV